VSYSPTGGSSCLQTGVDALQAGVDGDGGPGDAADDLLPTTQSAF
jgi:hypothetical protein